MSDIIKPKPNPSNNWCWGCWGKKGEYQHMENCWVAKEKQEQEEEKKPNSEYWDIILSDALDEEEV